MKLKRENGKIVKTIELSDEDIRTQLRAEMKTHPHFKAPKGKENSVEADCWVSKVFSKAGYAIATYKGDTWKIPFTQTGGEVKITSPIKRVVEQYIEV